jgi:hypothetical protein
VIGALLTQGVRRELYAIAGPLNQTLALGLNCILRRNQSQAESNRGVQFNLSTLKVDGAYGEEVVCESTWIYNRYP